MNNRSYRFTSTENTSFIPEYSGINGAIATHSNLSAQTAFMILSEDKGKNRLG